MIVAIDGPAGAGKSTVARALARKLGLRFLDTGAMYRAVALEVLRRGEEPASAQACGRVARELELAFGEGGRIRIDGRPGEPAIRSGEVTAAVSAVSAHREVRAAIVRRQRELAREWGGLVAEGRDTTTVVFPDAEHRFYLDASPAERARRRAHELGEPGREGEIRVEMECRDRLDSSRELSPLRLGEGVVRIDTNGLGPDEMVERVLAHLHGGRG